MSTRPTTTIKGKWTTFEVNEYITNAERKQASERFRAFILTQDAAPKKEESKEEEIKEEESKPMTMEEKIQKAAIEGKTGDIEDMMLEHVLIKINDTTVAEKTGAEIRTALDECPATDVDVLLAFVNGVFGGSADEGKSEARS